MALRSIKQAADVLGVSVFTVRRLAAAGLVRTVTVGRRRLVADTEIDRIVAIGVRSAVVKVRCGRRTAKRRSGPGGANA